MKPIGSRSAQLYGLAKVHKSNIPLRPIVSIPGTSYHKIGKFKSHWLDKIPENKIETSTSSLKNDITKIKLDADERLVSFDVSSLYTNVSVAEAIEMASVKLFQNTD